MPFLKGLIFSYVILATLTFNYGTLNGAQLIVSFSHTKQMHLLLLCVRRLIYLYFMIM